jgi:hypothetical protein
VHLRSLGVLAALSLAACGSPRSTDSGAPQDHYVPADATVNDVDADLQITGFEASAADGLAPDGPAQGAAFGPDPSPQACDGGPRQCIADPVCLDPRFAVTYPTGQCVSGSCVWRKADLDCAGFDGGACVGGTYDSGVADLGDAGRLGIFHGCALPLPPPPPAVACDAEASTDGGVCAPPHSVCALQSPLVGDQGSAAPLLYYYDDGQCISGQCTWVLRAMPCAYGCSAGACLFPFGTPPPVM